MLAGLFAGLACGVKLTAVPMLLMGIPVAAAAAVLLRRRGSGVGADKAMAPAPAKSVKSARSTLRDRAPEAVALPQIRERKEWRPFFGGFLVFVVLGTIVFSPWLIRNWRWTGNPVFPEQTERLGRGTFESVQVERWRRAHSPTTQQRPLLARLAAACDQILLDWRYGYLLLPMGLIAGFLSLRSPSARFLLLLLLIQFLVWIFFTHLQGRFFILAIPILSLLTAHLGNEKARRDAPVRGRGEGTDAAAPKRGHISVMVSNGLVALAVAVMGAVGLSSMHEKILPWTTNALGLSDYTPWVRDVLIPRCGLATLKDGHLVELTIEDFERLRAGGTGGSGGTGSAAAAARGGGPSIDLGSGEAFCYQVPSSRLRYRTVFDVPVPIAPSTAADPLQPLQAWFKGPPFDHAAEGKNVILVNPAELDRLSRTYSP